MNISPGNSGGGSLGFKWSSCVGAVLVLPQGADLEQLWSNDEFYHYAEQNASKFFDYACRRRRTSDPGSIYLVTGHSKTSAWGLATVSGTSEGVTLKFNASCSGAEGSLSVSCVWEQCGTAIPRVSPSQPGERRNQCIFVEGFTITKQKKSVFKRFSGRKSKYDISDIHGNKTKDVGWESWRADGSDSSSGSDNPASNSNSPTERGDSITADLPQDASFIIDDISSVPEVCILLLTKPYLLTVYFHRHMTLPRLSTNTCWLRSAIILKFVYQLEPSLTIA